MEIIVSIQAMWEGGSRTGMAHLCRRLYSDDYISYEHARAMRRIPVSCYRDPRGSQSHSAHIHARQSGRKSVWNAPSSQSWRALQRCASQLWQVRRPFLRRYVMGSYQWLIVLLSLEVLGRAKGVLDPAHIPVELQEGGLLRHQML